MRTVLVAVAVLLSACGDPFAPVGAWETFEPPAIYRTWYADAAACTGRTGDFSAIQWRVTDSLPSPSDHPTWETWGTWTVPHTVTLRRDHLLAEAVVKHEMLHDLLQTGDHNAILLGCATS